ncbi:MAG TPA: hypothetical protein PLT88_06310 [Bacteroidales bacterium]|jgi:hypothetical protein|nr:hypothetical protein [Bacteroidales bacterium]HRW27000.1 hypothetical protein [Bacteroidales bacterium]
MEENTASPTVVTTEENRMKKHVNIAGILQIVFGSILVIAALAIAIAFGFVDQFVDDPTAIKVLGFIGTPLVTLFLLFGAAMIAGGIGLFYCKPWARILTLVMAALGLLNVPVGTLKGVYIIWALVQSETISLFEKGCPSGKVQV